MSVSARIKKLLEVRIIDDWTRSFCESLLNQTLKGRKLSPRQLEILGQKEEAFNADAVAEENNWISSWTEEKAEIFRVCAMYYKNTGYFRSLAARVDHNGVIEENYIPPRRAYGKMCCNKFALKVRKAWFGDPKYPMGSVVTLRTSAPRYVDGQRLAHQRDGMPVSHFIVELNSAYPSSACSGAKVYRLIAAGDSTPFNIEERFIKKMRRTKKK